MLSWFSYVQFCDPMDCRLPDSSVHGILQARILEWVAMPSSRGSSRLWDWTPVSYVSCVDRQVLYHFCHMRRPISQILIQKITWLSQLGSYNWEEYRKFEEVSATFCKGRFWRKSKITRWIFQKIVQVILFCGHMSYFMANIIVWCTYTYMFPALVCYFKYLITMHLIID